MRKGRLFGVTLVCCAIGLGLKAPGRAACRAEEVLVVEQDYSIVRRDREGVAAKDTRQKLYLAKDWLRIDEFRPDSRQPAETYLIDLTKRLIVNLDNENLTKSVESFEKRQERIEERKRKVRSDLENLPEGPQKEKTRELYRGLLDDRRSFKLVREKDAEKKTIADVECSPIKVIATDEPGYVPYSAYLHPEVELPYDSPEVLYLLQIIGARMRDFLAKNKGQLRRLPMEMSLDVAAGGKLHASVVSVSKVDRRKLDPNLHLVPEGYKEKAVPEPPKPPAKAQPD